MAWQNIYKNVMHKFIRLILKLYLVYGKLERLKLATVYEVVFIIHD